MPERTAPKLAEHIEIVDFEDGTTHVLVDGLDISWWLAADGFSIEQRENSLPRLNVSLIAPRITRR